MKNLMINAETILFAGAADAVPMQAQGVVQKPQVKVLVKTNVPGSLDKDGTLVSVQSALNDEQAIQAANDLLDISSDKLTDNDLKALFAGK